jgi:hypothetical protein
MLFLAERRSSTTCPARDSVQRGCADARARARAVNKLALLRTKIAASGYCLTVFVSASEIAFLRSLYSLQPKKQILSSALRCSFALATLPTMR